MRPIDADDPDCKTGVEREMTGRLIDADAFKAQLQREIDIYFDEDGGGIHTAMEARDEIDYAPTVDAVPVRHGKYIGTEFDGYADGCPVYYEWKCSECGCVFEEEEPTYNYCPNCGARMDGEDEQPSSDACDQISEPVMERLKAEEIIELLGQQLEEVFSKINEVITNSRSEY